MGKCENAAHLFNFFDFHDSLIHYQSAMVDQESRLIGPVSPLQQAVSGILCPVETLKPPKSHLKLCVDLSATTLPLREFM